jgi:hypothetical protein
MWALAAIPLSLSWAWYGRNSPREHGAVSAGELALPQDPTSEQINDRLTLRDLSGILGDRHVLLITFAYFSSNYVFYLLANWWMLALFDPLAEERQVLAV